MIQYFESLDGLETLCTLRVRRKMDAKTGIEKSRFRGGPVAKDCSELVARREVRVEEVRKKGRKEERSTERKEERST